MAFVARMRDFFGYKPGGNATTFILELKELTYEDKVWFTDEFNKQGLTCQPPTKPVG